MKKSFVDVFDSKMHYLEKGAGDPILLLHTIPASSYLFRKIIPHLATLGRCIAPDLIGFGESDKPDISYTIEDHIRYLEKFIETLGLKRITLIMHGFGSILGFHYAMRHEKNCKGLVFYEAYLRMLTQEEISLPFQEQISFLNTEEQNLDLSVNGIQFVDAVLPQAMMQPLSAEEMSNYREPFLKSGTGKPIKQYWQEIPRGDGKRPADKIIANYSKKLTESTLPKLMLYSVPGFITTIADVMWAKENIPDLEIVEVGEDLHYAEESNSAVMGESISVWLQGAEQV